MPGERIPPLQPPAGWGEAFAALPTEAPPTPGWPRVAAALDARVRARWPLWLATAAALALVALVPLQWSRQDRQAQAPSLATSGTPSPEPRTPAPGTKPVAVPAGHGKARDGGDRTAAAAVASASAPSPSMEDPPSVAALSRLRGQGNAASTTRERPVAARMQSRTGPPGGAAVVEAASTSSAVLAGDGSASPARDIGTAVATTGSGAPDAELDRLYAESAQLEALVALARDDRMSTATAAALGDELEARVARIDAALVEPSATPEQRLGLWRERVDALRELAGFETTQRLLAARGEQYDAMLVSVD